MRQLLKLLLVVCLAGLMFGEQGYACGYYRLKYLPQGCSDGTYRAPNIVDVIRYRPTNLVRKTADNDNKLLKFTTNLAKGIIGEIPGGSFIGGLFDGFSGLFGGGGGPDLTGLYNQLADEILYLRKYTDNRIEEATQLWVEAQLGTTVPPTGLLGVAAKVRGQTGEDLKKRLNELHSFLVFTFGTFVPKTQRVVSYERNLPLFRQYGDLYVTTLVSEIQLFKKLGRDRDAAMKVTELKSTVDLFQAHWTKACGEILKNHTTLQNYRWSYWQSHAIGHAECKTPNMDGQTCVVKSSCLTYDLKKVLHICQRQMEDIRAKFVQNRRRQLLAYWKKQVGSIVQKWKMIASKMAKVQEAYIMSVSEEERSKFAIDQEVLIQSIQAGKPYNYHSTIQAESPSLGQHTESQRQDNFVFEGASEQNDYQYPTYDGYKESKIADTDNTPIDWEQYSDHNQGSNYKEIEKQLYESFALKEDNVQASYPPEDEGGKYYEDMY